MDNSEIIEPVVNVFIDQLFHTKNESGGYVPNASIVIYRRTQNKNKIIVEKTCKAETDEDGKANVKFEAGEVFGFTTVRLIVDHKDYPNYEFNYTLSPDHYLQPNKPYIIVLSKTPICTEQSPDDALRIRSWGGIFNL